MKIKHRLGRRPTVVEPEFPIHVMTKRPPLVTMDAHLRWAREKRLYLQAELLGHIGFNTSGGGMMMLAALKQGF